MLTEVRENRNISHPEESSDEADVLNEEIVRLLTWIIFTAVCQAVDVFGIVTNIINIVCFVRQGFRDSVNVSLLGLSVSDLGCLTTLSWINICMTPSIRSQDVPFDAPEVVYLVGVMPHFVFSRVTNWITAGITLERCLCIMAPLKIKQIATPKLTAVVVICIYIISVCSAIPMYVVNRLGTKFSSLRNITVFGLVFTEDRETVERICYTVNSLSVPSAAFIIIVVCTITLSTGLRRASDWRQKSIHAQSVKVNSRNQRVAKMVVVISILFISCFIPINTIMLALAFEPELSFGGKYFNIVVVLSGFCFILEAINSSVNIFIYYHMSSKYRQTLLGIFRKRKKIDGGYSI